METPRANPDELLRAIQSEDEKEQTGNLKIFFGYAAGVGKTYAMLKAAQSARQQGIDVVIGYVEPHSRPQTQALVNGLEQVPLQHISSDGINVAEFDVAAALKRKPQLILVDELAIPMPREADTKNVIRTWKNCFAQELMFIQQSMCSILKVSVILLPQSPGSPCGNVFPMIYLMKPHR